MCWNILSKYVYRNPAALSELLVSHRLRIKLDLMLRTISKPLTWCGINSCVHQAAKQLCFSFCSMLIKKLGKQGQELPRNNQDVYGGIMQLLYYLFTDHNKLHKGCIQYYHPICITAHRWVPLWLYSCSLWPYIQSVNLRIDMVTHGIKQLKHVDSCQLSQNVVDSLHPHIVQVSILTGRNCEEIHQLFQSYAVVTLLLTFV